MTEKIPVPTQASPTGGGVHPRISLVMPNYNGAEFIEAALASIVSQNYPDLDLIVVDGASRDRSLEAIDRFRSNITTLIVEPDGGHADALNKGFAAATGDIFCWLNSDDVLLPGALNFVGELFLNRPDIDWITGRPTSMDEVGNIGWVGPLRQWSRLRFLSGDNRWVQQESTFWRRALWDRAGGKLDTTLTVANDFELWTRFFRYADLHTVNRPLGCFRIRRGQRSIVMKKRYEKEARRALSDELAALEPQYRQELRELLPRSIMTLKSATRIRRDIRYAACDPPLILRKKDDGAISPRRKKGLTASPASAPDELSGFRGRHRGERCFVMGNGPSLNKMDLNRLAGQTVFACNSVFLLFDRIDWRPRYYTCVDSRVLPDRAAEIDSMLDKHPEMTGFFPGVIQEHTGAKLRRPTRFVLPAGPNRFFFNEEPNSTENLPHSMFSYDIDAVVVQPFTVAITMLQIAAYMGFSEIVLIGCDTNYVVAATVDRVQDREGSDVGLVSRKDDDANHFDPRYFGKNRKWHAPRPEKMIEHYEYAKEALDAIGVVVYNATVGGKLEVFPREDFKTFTI